MIVKSRVYWLKVFNEIILSKNNYKKYFFFGFLIMRVNERKKIKAQLTWLIMDGEKDNIWDLYKNVK